MAVERQERKVESAGRRGDAERRDGEPAIGRDNCVADPSSPARINSRDVVGVATREPFAITAFAELLEAARCADQYLL